VLLATDYFTKWVEAIPLKRVTSENMVEFVKEHIIYRFGIPQTITTDQGTQFTSSEFKDFAESMGLKLLNSSPYYAQANGQAEASNNIMIKIIQKKIDQKPKRWHSVLNEALWAYRMAPHGATQTSPYELFYGHHAVLSWEMQLESRRVVLQKDLSSKDYNDLMMDELEDLHMIRLRALENIEKNKMRVAKYYNKKVKVKQFAEGDLVWKALLLIGTKYSTFGKWSPNWEGPFREIRCTPGNAYILKTLLGEEFTAAINWRCLKKYIAITSVRNTEIASIRERSRLQNKNFLIKGNGQYLRVLSLARKCSALQTFLQVPLLSTWLLKITRKGLQEARCLEEEAKVCFISLVQRFSS
jgi:hypothetical protein